ncbi:hypothetical protein [Streptomyces sp. NPDC048521]|uniref:hypothetical protein n=1 Tax=Streptomyces sp. NPDC048521 TaxID=3365566 RepID=UPI0037166203
MSPNSSSRRLLRAGRAAARLLEPSSAAAARAGITPQWAAVVASGLLYLGMQVGHTVRNSNRWPWCSYNMFSYRSRDRAYQARVRLFTDRSTVVGPADPWGLLPLEFFRVVSLVDDVFIEMREQGRQEQFCRSVIELLNTSSWSRFDERRASFTPPPGERFVAIEVYLVVVDFRVCDPQDRTDVVSAELLHRHDPLGVAAIAEAPKWTLR